MRIVGQMPLTGTNKVLKAPLQQEGWGTPDDVWWRAERGDPGYRVLTEEDRTRLAEELVAHGRSYDQTP